MHQKLTEMEKEEYKKSVLEYEDVQKAVQYAREQGREEGREQGLAEGRETEKRLLILNMLAKGFDPDLVAEITGLTGEEVRAVSAEA